MNSILLALSLAFRADALLPLVASGNMFYQLKEDYTADPVPFPIYGVDYQPGGSSGFSMTSSSDILTDAAACQRDAYLLQKLGANAIRIYSVSPWNNHDECMTIFNDAGIYVLLDINTPDSSLHRFNPEESYNEGYLNNVFGLVDAFKNYPNVMGFLAGNEIINDDKSAQEDPKYIRAVIRDVKQYIDKWSNRTIPVGYAAADVLEYRTETWKYFECNANDGNSTEDYFSRADFFGINTYSWCSGVNDWTSSGYKDIQTTFANSSIPIVFTEYGCNTKSPRTFDEVDQGIYGPLADVVAGAFLYEYSNEVSNYGLAEIDSDGNVSLLQDYENLSTAFSKASKTTTSASPTSLVTGTAALNAAPTCNSQDATGEFGWDLSLPDSPATDLMKSGGGNRNVGSFISSTSSIANSYHIVDVSGSTITPNYSYNAAYQINSQTNIRVNAASETSKTISTAAASTTTATSKAASVTAASSSATSSSSSSKSKNSGNLVALPIGMGALVTLLFSLI